MKYLFSSRDELKRSLNGRFIFLFMDYDGTLTPIMESPDKAVISEEMKDLLDKLSASSRCRVAIISGRSLRDIKRLVGLKNIIYSGNHGLEMGGPKIKFESPVSLELKSLIRHIYEDAAGKFSGIKGVLIEDKGLTVSVHYRLADKKDIKKLSAVFAEITGQYVVRGKIKINAGKKVYEAIPDVKWDKGKIVSRLLDRRQFLPKRNKALPVYIGDDVTDEAAFREIKNKGVTIFVGKPKESHARYYLKDYNEVRCFLEMVLEAVRC